MRRKIEKGAVVFAVAVGILSIAVLITPTSQAQQSVLGLTRTIVADMISQQLATNLWAGPTNTLLLTTNYQFFVATGDCNITNVGGQVAGQNTWATVTVSNSTASDITVRLTAAGLRAQGITTTTALVIGAGKEGYVDVHCRDFKSTNFITSAQSN